MVVIMRVTILRVDQFADIVHAAAQLGERATLIVDASGFTFQLMDDLKCGMFTASFSASSFHFVAGFSFNATERRSFKLSLSVRSLSDVLRLTKGAVTCDMELRLFPDAGAGEIRDALFLFARWSDVGRRADMRVACSPAWDVGVFDVPCRSASTANVIVPAADLMSAVQQAAKLGTCARVDVHRNRCVFISVQAGAERSAELTIPCTAVDEQLADAGDSGWASAVFSCELLLHMPDLASVARYVTVGLTADHPLMLDCILQPCVRVSYALAPVLDGADPVSSDDETLDSSDMQDGGDAK